MSNTRLAFIGIACIVLGFLLGSGADVVFPGQDPAGRGMAAGLMFFAGAFAGIACIATALVRARRG